MSIVGDETFPPYCRPMISLLLEGRITKKDLPIRSSDFYQVSDIKPMLGSRVSRLDPEQKTLATADNQSLSYDRFLIASGSDPRAIKAENQNLENIFYMRNHAQVQAMTQALPAVQNALVLGGGLVGFKAAYGLLRRCILVTMLIRSDYPLSMQVDATAGQMIREVLESQGLDVRVGDQVNVIVLGHNPVISEMVRLACQDSEMIKFAEARGAKGINLCGLCCTGNELLMRHGIPVAGNHLMTELVIAAGAVEMMIVDYQCIMPSLDRVADCYHTRMISTSDKARFPGMEHIEFHPDNAREKACELLKRSVMRRQSPIKLKVSAALITGAVRLWFGTVRTRVLRPDIY
ncbi:MAG: FAD-dependent oxidoreductase [Thermodesulfobacteriota bacterium]